MKGLSTLFKDWNVDGALVRPNGITKNSMALMCHEAFIVDIVQVHAHLVVAAVEVKLGEEQTT